MDGCIYPYSIAKALGTQPELPGEGVRAIDALRAQVAAAAPSRLVEHTEEGDNVGYSHAPTDVPRQFATPPGAALTF